MELHRGHKRVGSIYLKGLREGPVAACQDSQWNLNFFERILAKAGIDEV